MKEAWNESPYSAGAQADSDTSQSLCFSDF